MELNIDILIDLFKKHSTSYEKLHEDEPANTSTGTETTGKVPKKWESGRVLGKTYMNSPTYKWESGRKFGKTYMNDVKYKWASDRVMGKTSGSDF